MTSTDRRHPENTQLREKISHIQDVSKQLQNLVAQVQVRTVAWAREGKVVDLPSADLAVDLSHAFEQQRVALTQIQEDIKGKAVRVPASALITDEELAALMK